MGHYSLWPIFQALGLDAPVSVESTPTHVSEVNDDICVRIRNDYSFPTACTIRMRFASNGQPARSGHLLVRRRHQARRCPRS